MKVLAGIVLIVVGGLYPLFAVYRMNKRLGRDDAPTGMRFILWLIFTLTLPLAMALLGTALVIPPLAASGVFQGVVVGLWIAVLAAGTGYRLWPHR